MLRERRDFKRWLSIKPNEVMGANIHQAISGPRKPGAFDGDQSSPMTDAELASMVGATLSSFHNAYPDTGIKVLRLRYFVGYPQGVVVAADKTSSQLVWNTRTGAIMTMWEPGYPDLSFPTGWELHQKLKQFHRGDLFGMPGRWLILLAGMSLVYLSLSGCVMWLQQYRRRRDSGRNGLFWK